MGPQLRKVDSLNITFLVDNSVEWSERFPGLGNAIVDPISQETEITGEEPQSTLFDTGPDSISLIRNIRALDVKVDKIDRVILSHWHADHSGGILSFLRHRGPTPQCTIDLHPDRPAFRGIAPPPYDKVLCSLPADPTFEQIEQAGGVVEKYDQGHLVANGTVWVSGKIPRVTEFEEGLLGGSRWVGDKWVQEPHIMDERYAAVDVAGKGLIIFSACSHAGIVNVVKDAVTVLQRPIHMIIGGLHLATPDLAYRIPLTVDFVFKQLKPSPTYILPMHCTGFNAKIALEAAGGAACVPAGAGLKVNVKGDKEHDKRLYAPTF